MVESRRRTLLRLLLGTGSLALAGCNGTFSSSGEAQKLKDMEPGDYRDKMEEDQLEQTRKSKRSTGKRTSR